MGKLGYTNKKALQREGLFFSLIYLALFFVRDGNEKWHLDPISVLFKGQHREVGRWGNGPDGPPSIFYGKNMSVCLLTVTPCYSYQ
jgi:hypothetical protein